MPTPWVDLPFLEAVAYLRSLAPTPKDTYDAMSQDAQDLAFTVSRISKVEVLQEVLGLLRDAAESGKTLQDFVDEAQFTGLSDAHLETIYRTNLQSAFGRGSYDKLTDPALGGAFWGWRYHTVEDDRVRESHAVLDGLEFRTGAHDEVYPPWAYQCRCSAEPITWSEAKDGGYESDPLPPEAQQALAETDFRSPALKQTYVPDLNGIDLGLVSHYLQDSPGKPARA